MKQESCPFNFLLTVFFVGTVSLIKSVLYDRFLCRWNKYLKKNG